MVDEQGMEVALASKERREWDMEEDCINHFFECESYDTYEKIVFVRKREPYSANRGLGGSLRTPIRMRLE